MAARFAVVTGHACSSRRKGAGRPVVPVPDVGYAAWSWAGQRSAVAQAAGAVVMDNRGCIALTVALARPDLVRSLVLVSTSIGGPDAVPVPEETRVACRAAGLPVGAITVPTWVADGLKDRMLVEAAEA